MRRAVIFWSKYNNIEAAIPAGIAASHSFEDVLAKREDRRDHFLPVEVTKFNGNCNAGKEAIVPQRRRAALAAREPTTTPMAGAKFERFFRID